MRVAGVLTVIGTWGRVGGMSKKKKHVSMKRKVALFLSYWGCAAVVAALAIFYVEELMRPVTLILIVGGTVVFALVSTIVHVKQGKHSAIDDIADRF
ncbi:MAG: hypothetical protein AAF591_09510 [Verrucomicrobiota bacterium]